MTAKEEGLWDPIGNVTREEIKHMKARVELFRATHVVGDDPDDFEKSPECGPSWCRWILVDSLAYAARQPPRAFPGHARREPKALPELAANPTRTLTPEQKAMVAKRREEAQRRRMGQRRQLRSLTPEQKAMIAEKKEEGKRRKISGKVTLTPAQKAITAEGKELATLRKQEKAFKEVTLPQVPSDEEDVFGFDRDL